MEEKVVIKSIAKYNGHNVRANKSVDISFKFNYDELSKYITLVQLLNENVKIVVKQPNEKAEVLGIFMIKDLRIDHDGVGTIKFNSMTDQSEVQLLHHLVGDEPFKIKFIALIELEEEKDD